MSFEHYRLSRIFARVEEDVSMSSPSVQPVIFKERRGSMTPSTKTLSRGVKAMKGLTRRKSTTKRKDLLFESTDSTEILLADLMYKKRSGFTGVATGFAASIFHHENPKEKIHGGRLWILRYFVLYKSGKLSYFETTDEQVSELEKLASDDSFQSLVSTTGMVERGCINLLRNGAQLRMTSTGDADREEPYSGTIETTTSFRDIQKPNSPANTDPSPSPFQFDISSGSSMNPKDWQSWTLCATNVSMFYQWTNAVRDAMYAPLKTHASFEDESESDDEEVEVIDNHHLSVQFGLFKTSFTYRRKIGELTALLCLSQAGFLALNQPENTLYFMVQLAASLLIMFNIYSHMESSEQLINAVLPLFKRKSTARKPKPKQMKSVGGDSNVELNAGESLPYMAKPDGAENCWTISDDSHLMMRIGPDYKKNKAKGPTKTALFRTIGVDMFESDKKLMNVAGKFVLPFDKAVSSETIKDLGLPRILIVNFQLPRPSALAYSSADGPGFNLPMYYTPSDYLVQACRDKLAGKPVEAAVNLLLKWFTESPLDQTWKERLKLIAFILNPDSCGMPGWTQKFNGKPVMIRKSGVITKTNDVFEIDIDIRLWGIMSRQGVSALIPGPLKKMDFIVSFVIQGDENDELPERAMVATQFCFLDATRAVSLETI